jgi:hypothetical protein
MKENMPEDATESSKIRFTTGRNCSHQAWKGENQPGNDHQWQTVQQMLQRPDIAYLLEQYSEWRLDFFARIDRVRESCFYELATVREDKTESKSKYQFCVLVHTSFLQVPVGFLHSLRDIPRYQSVSCSFGTFLQVPVGFLHSLRDIPGYQESVLCSFGTILHIPVL